jgi:hypothetical protein
MTFLNHDTDGRSGAALALRIGGGVVAVGSMLALVAGVGAAAAAPTAAPGPHKSYICKYVSKPGETERLQTGNNPIWTDNHSLLGYDGTVTVGQEFKDAQGRSVVIVANTDKLDPEPSVADCPPPAPPTSTTTTPPTSTTSTTTSTTTTSTTTTSTTTPPPSTTTTSTSPTTGTTTTAGPVSTVTTYPLQPVKGGVSVDPARANPFTPGQAGLLLLAVLGLVALLAGHRFPRALRLTRIRAPRE